MSCRTTGTNRGMTKVGLEKELNYKLGEVIDYEVELPEGFENAELKVNDRIDLPEGLDFDGTTLNGEINAIGLHRIDLIATSGSNKAAIKILIRITPDEAEYDYSLMERLEPSEEQANISYLMRSRIVQMPEARLNTGILTEGSMLYAPEVFSV